MGIVKVVGHAVDVGVDVIVAGERNRKKARGRTARYTARARKFTVLFKPTKKAYALVNTGSKAQYYGVLALGATREEVRAQARNIVVATGFGGKTGAGSTLAIEWILGLASQPTLRYSKSYIRAWFRCLDCHGAERGTTITEAWHIQKRSSHGML